MCEFISWIGLEGEVYFLTDSDLNTKEGRKLLTKEYHDDIPGHGAIRHYYPELKGRGVNKECVDFSTPNNFPNEIVKAILEGRFRGFGIARQILTPSAWKEYNKIEQPALKEYEKIEQPTWEEYRKIEQPALKVYKKIRQSAWKEYEKTTRNKFWDLVKIKRNRTSKWK